MTGGNSPRRKGYTFERKVVKRLEKNGWFVARQGRSKFPDIVAVSPTGRTYFVECKVNVKSLSRKEKIDLLELMNKYHGTFSVVAYREKRGIIGVAGLEKKGNKVALIVASEVVGKHIMDIIGARKKG